jgi:hypothetical protein
MVTSSDDTGDLQLAFDAGAMDYLIKPPKTTIGLPGCALSSAMASGICSRTSRVPCQVASVSVVEKTTFSISLSRRATSPSCEGQNAAKPSYVLRPNSSVSAPLRISTD